MTYGLVASRSAAHLSLTLRLLMLSVLTLVPIFIPTAAVLARRAAASEISGTLLAVSASTLSVQGRDGRTIVVAVTPQTWLLKSGLPVSAAAFSPGDSVQIRTGRSGQALLVCDPETAEALSTQRGHRLTGTILRCDRGVWIVQPDAGTLPLPVCLTPRTVFSAAGSRVPASAFGAGTAVTVTTRGLANGLLSAVSVAAAGGGTDNAGTGDAEPKPRPASVSGTVLEVRAELGVLVLQDKTGAARTIAVDSATRIKLRQQPASLGDIMAGMHLTGRLSSGTDANGRPIATSLSASDALPEKARR